MKKVLFFIFACVMVLSVDAQDVITLKNGEEIQVKVTKVGDNEIEYKKWSNQNGPTYSKSVSEIFMIKYENGEKEVYNQTVTDKNNTEGSITNQGGVFHERIGGDRMRRDGRDLKIGTRELTENDIRRIFYEDGLSTYKKGRRNIAAGNALWPIGTAIGTVGYIVFWAYVFEYDDEPAYAVGLPFIGVGSGLFTAGLILKGTGKGRLDSLVDEYNSGRGNSLTLSVQPSLMRTFDKSYAPGLGLALRF